MMKNDMLANIEYLREKANVSYEEAERLLEQYDGNVMRALVELEHQGRVFSQAHAGTETRQDRPQYDIKDCDGMKKTKAFVRKAIQTRLIVEKKTDDGKTNMMANVPVPFAALVAVCAPWLTVGTAAVVFVTGHNVRIEKDETEQTEA